MEKPFIIELWSTLAHNISPLLNLLSFVFTLPQNLLKKTKITHFNQKFENGIELITHILFYLIYLTFFLNFHFTLFFHFYQKTTLKELIVSYIIIHLLTTIIYKVYDMRFFIWRDPPYFIFCLLYFIVWILHVPLFIVSFNKDIYSFICFVNGREDNTLKLFLTFFVNLFSAIYDITIRPLIKIVEIVGKAFNILGNVISYVTVFIYDYLLDPIGKFVELIIHKILKFVFDYLLYPIGKILELIILKIFTFMKFVFDYLLYPIGKILELIIEKFLHFMKFVFDKTINRVFNYIEMVFTFIFTKIYDLIAYFCDKCYHLIFINFNESIKFVKEKIASFFIFIFDHIIYPLIYHIGIIFETVFTFIIAKIINFIEIILDHLSSVLQYFYDILKRSIMFIPNFISKILLNITKVIEYFLKIISRINYKLKAINCILFSIEIIIYTISPFIIVYNHLNLVHYFSLKKLKNGKNLIEKLESKFIILNLFIFYQKTFDIIIGIFVLFKILTIHFYVDLVAYIIMHQSQGQGEGMPNIFTETDSFLEKVNVSNERINFDCISASFHKRRINIITSLLKDLFYSACLVLTFPLILDPFYGLRYIQTIFVYVKVCLSAGKEKDQVTSIQNCKIFNNNIKNNFKILIEDIKLFCQYIWFFIDPWNLLCLLKFSFNFSIVTPIKKMKNDDFPSSNYNIERKEVTEFLNNSEIQQMKGFTLIFRFIILHISLIRAFIFWSDVIKNSNKIYPLLKEHSNKAITEFLFYIPLLLCLILSPWNYSSIIEFFRKSAKITKKATICYTIFYQFLLDYYALFNIIICLFSFVQTFEIFYFLYLAFKKNILKNSNSIIQYESYFKYDFHKQITVMRDRVLKYLLIILLFILNFILISEIPSLIRRTKNFMKKKIKKNILFILIVKKTDIIMPKLNEISICSIADFLEPREIVKMSSISKFFYSKFNTNLVWKNKYEDFYKKLLSKQNKIDLYKMINLNHYQNFKSVCKELHKLLDKSELSEEERDTYIGLNYVLLEITISSLLKIPHLVLIPMKVLYLPLMCVKKIVKSIFIKYNQYIGRPILGVKFYDEIIKENSIIEIISAIDYYNIHLFALWNLILIIVFVILIISTIIMDNINFVINSLAFIYNNIIIKIFNKTEELARIIILFIYNPIKSFLTYLLTSSLNFIYKVFNFLYSILKETNSLLELIFFPQYSVFILLYKNFKSTGNILLKFLLNFLSLIFTIFPFGLNFILERNLVTLISVNAYAVINIYKFIKMK